MRCKIGTLLTSILESQHLYPFLKIILKIRRDFNSLTIYTLSF